MGLEEIFKNIIQDYGYLGLLIALALEFIGLPVPGETLMIFVGFQAYTGNMGFYTSILFAFIGTNVGSFIAYYIGKLLGRDFLIKYGKYVLLDTKKLTIVERWFKKYQVILFILGRYIIGVRHFVPYLGGIYKTDIKSFTFYNFIGSLIWCVSFITTGSIVGKNWSKIAPLIHEYTIEIAIVSAVVIIAFMVIKRSIYKRASR